MERLREKEDEVGLDTESYSLKVPSSEGVPERIKQGLKCSSSHKTWYSVGRVPDTELTSLQAPELLG